MDADGQQTTDSESIPLVAKMGRTGRWRLDLAADALLLSAEEGDERIEVPREEAEERLGLPARRSASPLLLVRIGRKQALFELPDGEAGERLRGWVGPPTIRGLRAALRKRLRWCLPIGVVFVLTSLPLPGDPEAGLEHLPFDPVAAGLGASLIVLTLLARLHPRRVYLLLDGIWFLLLAAELVHGIVRGGDNAWWGLLAALMVISALAAFAEYQRFAGMVTATTADGTESTES